MNTEQRLFNQLYIVYADMYSLGFDMNKLLKFHEKAENYFECYVIKTLLTEIENKKIKQL